MLCLHQQKNKNIFTPKCNGSESIVYQTKHIAKGDKTTEYLIKKDYLYYEK